MTNPNPNKQTIVLVTCWGWQDSGGAEIDLVRFFGTPEVKFLSLPGGGCADPVEIWREAVVLLKDAPSVLILAGHEACIYGGSEERLQDTMAALQKEQAGTPIVGFWFYQEAGGWKFRLASSLNSLLVAAAAIACDRGECLTLQRAAQLIEFADPSAKLFDVLNSLRDKGKLIQKGGRQHHPSCGVLSSRDPISAKPNSRC